MEVPYYQLDTYLKCLVWKPVVITKSIGDKDHTLKPGIHSTHKILTSPFVFIAVLLPGVLLAKPSVPFGRTLPPGVMTLGSRWARWTSPTLPVCREDLWLLLCQPFTSECTTFFFARLSCVVQGIAIARCYTSVNIYNYK